MTERQNSNTLVHTPVMLNEVLALFESLGKTDAKILDCTLGAGGHAEALLSRYPRIHYTGIDADPEACARAGERLAPFADRLEVVQGYFDDCMETFSQTEGFIRPDFVLFDLGVSKFDFFDSGRGFSFSSSEPLDMRFSPDAAETAADIVNHYDEKSLADLIYELGGERYSRRIAKAIVDARKIAPIRDSAKLAGVVAGAVPPEYRRGRLHPATKTFQALRIKVNDELGRDARGLALAASLLAPNGVLVVISFHSLEDGIAKRYFRELITAGSGQVASNMVNKTSSEATASAKSGLATATTVSPQFRLEFKKPLVPTDEEIAANPASRSAKLRAIRKLPLEAATSPVEAATSPVEAATSPVDLAVSSLRVAKKTAKQSRFQSQEHGGSASRDHDRSQGQDQNTSNVGLPEAKRRLPETKR